MNIDIAKKANLRRHFLFRGSLIRRSLDTVSRWAEWNRPTPGFEGFLARIYLRAIGRNHAPDKFRCAELLRKAFSDAGVTDQSIFNSSGQ